MSSGDFTGTSPKQEGYPPIFVPPHVPGEEERAKEYAAYTQRMRQWAVENPIEAARWANQYNPGKQATGKRRHEWPKEALEAFSKARVFVGMNDDGEFYLHFHGPDMAQKVMEAALGKPVHVRKRGPSVGYSNSYALKPATKDIINGKR
jgi:hypothetical protein